MKFLDNLFIRLDEIIKVLHGISAAMGFLIDEIRKKEIK